MPTDSTFLSLTDLQKTPVAELRAIAAHSDNYQYSVACEQMAHGAVAYAAGDIVTMKAHVARAVIAHKRAREDEAGQVRRAAMKREQLAADGIGETCEVAGFGTTHFSMRETHRSTGERRRLNGAR